MTVVRPFIERPEITIAAGGIIRDANGCEVTRGHVTKVGLPRAVAADVPDRRVPARLHRGVHGLEHDQLAADHLGRVGIFRTDAVIDVGGFASDSIGVDFERCMRLHARMRGKCPYHMAFVPDPVCWTEAPRSSGSSAASATAGTAASPTRSAPRR